MIDGVEMFVTIPQLFSIMIILNKLEANKEEKYFELQKVATKIIN